MTSAGHRTALAHIGRAPDDFCLKFISYNSNSAWAQYLPSARNFMKYFNKPEDARPGTGRCFMSRTATGEKRCVYAEVHLDI